MAANTAKGLSPIRGVSLTQSLSFPDERVRTKPAKMASPASRGEASRTRSVSPPRTKVYDWEEFSRIDEVEEDDLDENGGAAAKKTRRWSLKEFLYRSISEGRGRAREKEMAREKLVQDAVRAERMKKPASNELGHRRAAAISKKTSPAAVSKESAAPPRSTAQRREAVSAHERYYLNRARAQAQAEKMKKKTFLPYRQGLLGFFVPFQNSNGSNHDAVLPAS